jgi:glycosyltransferase involved in cell wall biosynthesis
MNIGIDARLLSTKIRGTSRYLANIIQYLPQFDKTNKYYLFQYEDLPTDNKFYTYVQIEKGKLPRQIYEHYWLNFILPRHISELNIDIFFTPYIFVPLRKRTWKNVIVIADSLTKTCKEYYTYHYRKYMDILVPPSIKRSDSIVTISNSAKQDILRFYKVQPDKIQVMHLWTDDKYKPVEIAEIEKRNLLIKYNLPAKFILFVSVLEERKNITSIIKVSDVLASRGFDIKFVLVGREGFGYQKIESELKKRSKNIIHLKFVDDKDLILLYNLSTIFFFPSYHEGFGLPPLEAMKCGIPVISSNNSSLPEVIGEGGIMGDANDYDFFVESIISLLTDEMFYTKMKHKALEQAKKFKPDNLIIKLINVFNSLK